MSHSFTFRPGTCDEEVFNAVNACNEYRLPDSFRPDDIILDIGTHIGSFCNAALERGAQHVYGFEAFSKNFECARRNLSSYGDRVLIQNKAVWRSDKPVKTLTFSSLENQNNAAGHVIGAQGGTGIDAVAFDEIVMNVTRNGRKRVRLVKLDCEGSEYTILFTSKKIHLIDSIIGEYHNFSDNYNNGPGEDHFFHKIPEHAKVDGYNRFIHEDLDIFLKQAGFDVTIVPHPDIPNLAGWFFAHRVAPPSLIRERIQWHWDGVRHKLDRLRKAA